MKIQEFLSSSRRFGCLFERTGLPELGACSANNDRVICRNHLERLFNIEVEEHIVNTTENETYKLIFTYATKLMNNTTLFPIVNGLLESNELCQLPDIEIFNLLDTYVRFLFPDSPNIREIVGILSVFMTGTMLPGIQAFNAICSFAQAYSMFQSNPSVKALVDGQMKDRMYFVQRHNVFAHVQGVKLPMYLKLLLPNFESSNIVISGTADNINLQPNILLHTTEHGLVRTTTLNLLNRSATTGTPLVLYGLRTSLNRTYPFHDLQSRAPSYYTPFDLLPSCS